MDWALMESWKERGVPLHVALRGIEHAFESHELKKRKRSVKSLLYCQEEVEAQYAEWVESRVGSQEAAVDSEADSTSQTIFSRDVLLNHLNQSLERVTQLRDSRNTEDELGQALARAAALLSEIREDFSTAAQTDARKLEQSLTGIDRLLDGEIPMSYTANAQVRAERPLNAYAFDPSQGKNFGNFMTILVKNEAADDPPQKILRGPIGKDLAVIDYDATNDVYYQPVDLN